MAAGQSYACQYVRCGSREITKQKVVQLRKKKKKITTLKFLLSVFLDYPNQLASKSQCWKNVINVPFLIMCLKGCHLDAEGSQCFVGWKLEALLDVRLDCLTRRHLGETWHNLCTREKIDRLATYCKTSWCIVVCQAHNSYWIACLALTRKTFSHGVPKLISKLQNLSVNVLPSLTTKTHTHKTLQNQIISSAACQHAHQSHQYPPESRSSLLLCCPWSLLGNSTSSCLWQAVNCVVSRG